MSNIVYKYPLSSCTYTPHNNDKDGIPTNMSVRNCNVNAPPLQFSNTTVQPNSKEGLTAINPQVYQDKYAKDFRSEHCKESSSCPSVQWVSPDPRLISATHFGQRQTLSNPPIDSTVRLNQLDVDEKLNGYGQNYGTYANVNAGQILYYTDHSREDAFYKPLFTDSAMVTGYLYKDPMDALKPVYDRVPIVQNDPMGPKRDNYSGGLSWIQDSTSHREDLMSRQMNIRNQQRWMPRWSD